MNGRVTIILLAVCLALGAYLYIVPAPSTVPEDIAAKRTDIINLVTAEVNGFSVFRNDGTTIEVARNGEGWALTQPLPALGDDIAIGQVVAAISQLQAQEVIEKPGDAEAYGLLAPTLTIIFQGKYGQMAFIRVGDRNPSGGARYVQVDKDPRVFLVSDPVIDTIDGWFTMPPLKPTALPDLPKP
ncbi:MAG: hypothetical protein RLZZ297_24 [Chloroflexota bacterium]|jgi:hypothetical protein